jgi:signal transduction histidine kinase/CheY-like chemotaxis protein
MKKVLFIVYSAVLIIVLANVIFYKSLYNNQISYVFEMLDRQIQIVGQIVDSTNTGFMSDLNQISLSDDLVMFFDSTECERRTKENMKLFFLKYKTLVTGIEFYNNNRYHFSLQNDGGTGEWLEQTFTSHEQPEISTSEILVLKDRKFYYLIPVTKKDDSVPFANLAVKIDFGKYFSELYSVFNIKEYQWQWILDEEGKIFFTNKKGVEYQQLEKVAGQKEGRSMDKVFHKAVIDGTSQDIISSWYSVQFLQKNLKIVFSAPVNLFQKYIIRNSLLIVIVTLLLIQVIILVFMRFIKAGKAEKENLIASEEVLFRMIDELPAGIIIYNKNREITRANRVAAAQYSYAHESEMKGKIYPEIAHPDESDLYSHSSHGIYNPSQFITVKRDSGQILLYRYSITDIFMGEKVTMDILLDITNLESSLKQEAKASIEKTEFLARMSFEIRTPLNGIIGMADVLNKFNLAPGIKQIVTLLHRSTYLLLGIVNDILDFSKLESGRIILDEAPFLLRNEIGYCSDIAKSSRAGKEIVIKSFVEDNVPETIVGDSYRFRQVLTNLLLHSVKNTDKGEISLKCTQTANKNGIVTLRFELMDTGKSFDKITLKKIFGEFVSFDPGSVNNEESGFAILLTKQLIELMGGELTAVSPSGLAGPAGTKVIFTMLAHSGDRPKKDLVLENIKSYDKIKTLVITGTQGRDEEVLSSLHKLGLNVSITTYLKSTVNQLKTNLSFPDTRYYLIVILNDKDFNGFDVAAEIWDRKLSGHFVIIMISSNDVKGNFIKCLSLGIDHYMVKPFDINELVGNIANSFPSVEDKVSSVSRGRQKSEIMILVVEDNKINQMVMGSMLQGLGYSYELADDGSVGYMKAKSKKYDLIMMDLLMPEMDGYTSAQKIMEFDKSTIIVAFTADNSLDARKKSELVGIKDFISKPVRVNDLKTVLQRYL